MNNLKPFIHLVQSPMSKAFYDVNTNSLVRVDVETYNYLENLVMSENEACNYAEHPLTRRLFDSGYLSNKRVSHLEHPATHELEDLLDRSLRLLTLQLTQNCNLRCAYCIYSEKTNERQRAHSKRSMSFETAKKAVDFLVKHSVDTETVAIGFYGG